MNDRPPPNTPGAFGYLFGFAVSCLVLALLLLAPGLRFYDLANQLAVLVVYVPLITAAGLFLGAPVALVGCLVTQLVCARTASQAVHVVVLGLVAGILAVVFLRTTGADGVERDPTYVAVAVGVAAALGRLAAVPMVRSRRRLAAEGRLTGTARW